MLNPVANVNLVPSFEKPIFPYLMADISTLISNIEDKANALTARCDQLELEKQALLEQTNTLNRALESKQSVIEELKEKNELLKMAGSLAGDESQVSEAKLKINELVREIDKCIALLNK